MKLTFKKRMAICVEVLFARSGHAHTAQEKQLSTFMNGHRAGMKDQELEFKSEEILAPISVDDEVL